MADETTNETMGGGRVRPLQSKKFLAFMVMFVLVLATIVGSIVLDAAVEIVTSLITMMGAPATTAGVAYVLGQSFVDARRPPG